MASFFSQIRVLDMSASYCGRLTTMALADLGCDVVRLVRPDEQIQFTDRGKTLCALDPQFDLAPLIDQADVIIEDLPLPMLLAMDETPVSNQKGIIHCWMPAFAHDDTLVDFVGHEHAISSASGMFDKPLGRRPSMTHLSTLSVTSAAYALNGILGALMARQRDGRGQTIRLVRSDVAYAILELNGLLTQSPPKSWASLQWAASPWLGAYGCAGDSHVYIHAGLRKHLHRLLDVLDQFAPTHTRDLRAVLSEQTYSDPTSVPSVKEVRQTRKHLSALFKKHPAWFWVQKLSAQGLCAVEVLDTKTWFEHDHPTQTEQVIPWQGQIVPGSILETHTAAQAFNVATLNDVCQKWTERQKGERPKMDNQQPPLDGIKVLDLTQVIAGPTAGRTLAELGAQVHRIENPHFDAPWVEAFHVAYNAGKTQQTMDLSQPASLAQFWTFVASFKPDVILNNYRPGAAKKMGLSEEDFRSRLPNVIYAHLSAYGSNGPWGHLPGWEQTAQAVTGVQWDYGDCPKGTPELYPLPLNDLATGLFGAYGVIAALLTAQDEQPQRTMATSLSRTATWMQGYAQCVQTQRVKGADSLGLGVFDTHYKANDGWLYLSIQPGQERALLHIVGLEHVCAYEDPRLRKRALERAFLASSVAQWIDRVRVANVANRMTIVPWRTQKQMFKAQRAQAAQLIHRRTHPGIGAVTETGSALQMSRTPTINPLPAAPVRLGQTAPKQTLSQTTSWLKQQTVGAISLLWKDKS